MKFQTTRSVVHDKHADEVGALRVLYIFFVNLNFIEKNMFGLNFEDFVKKNIPSCQDSTFVVIIHNIQDFEDLHADKHTHIYNKKRRTTHIHNIQDF